MFSQYLVPSITKKFISFLFVGSGTVFIKVFQYILKSVETFFNSKLYLQPKNTKNTKKPGQILI